MLTQNQQNLMKPSRRAALESAVGNVYSEEFLRAFELPSMDQKCQRMVHATASLVLLVILVYQVSSKLSSTAAGARVVLSTGFLEVHRPLLGLGQLAPGHSPPGAKESSGADGKRLDLQSSRSAVRVHSGLRNTRRTLRESLSLSRNLFDVDEIIARLIPRLRRIPAAPPQKHYKIDPGSPGDPPLRDISFLDHPSVFTDP